MELFTDAQLLEVLRYSGIPVIVSNVDMYVKFSDIVKVFPKIKDMSANEDIDILKILEKFDLYSYLEDTKIFTEVSNIINADEHTWINKKFVFKNSDVYFGPTNKEKYIKSVDYNLDFIHEYVINCNKIEEPLTLKFLDKNSINKFKAILYSKYTGVKTNKIKNMLKDIDKLIKN